MGFYINKIYIEKRDIYALLALGLIGYARYIEYPIQFIDYDETLIITALFLLAKSFVLPAHDSVIFIVFISALLLSLFTQVFQIILFIFLALLFLKLFKVI